MDRGLRPGCNISALVFNLYLSDMEREISKVKEGGIVVGKKRFGQSHMQTI